VQKRRAGTILHLSSLPGSDAIGTILDGIPFLGALKKSGLKTWQILPIGPTIIGDSPFQGPSAFAGNPNLISLEQLVRAGDLTPAALKRYQAQHAAYLRRYRKVTPETVHYEFLWRCKIGFDRKSWGYKKRPASCGLPGFQQWPQRAQRQKAYARFVRRWDKVWLADYAMFMALKAAYGFPKQWSSWKAVDRFRRPGFGAKARREDIEFFKYVQFVFDEQMQLLHAGARSAGIEIVGDIPMYPAYDSADVWANPELFQLGADLKSTHVACVPPDNFNPKGGQLWGNPLYKWGIMGNAQIEKLVYEWWEKRLRCLFVHHDVIKIDHFRGLVAYGRVSAKARNACAARWTAGPGSRMLKFVQKNTGRLAIIAEDLGV
jgi:4-alpha-glucanotransferase